MKIYERTSNKIKKISVIGELESKKEKEFFFTLIKDKDVFEINITFLNAKILPTEIINKLTWLQKYRKSKISVRQRYLYSYLYNMGIKCKYIDKKPFNYQYDFSNSVVKQGTELCEKQITSFLKDIYERYGYDYREYQIESIRRRLKIAMLRNNIKSFQAFREDVLENEDIFEQFFLDLSINTTSFFRDTQVFATIKDKILPYLYSYPHIKIWSAGCSNGKEAYSLAILLYELGILEKTQIYATDLNPYIVEEAKNGLFSLDTIESDIENYRIASGDKNFIDYFEFYGSYMKIKKVFQKNILFFQHSLINSGILNEFQLILCRNVLIYFNSDLQVKVLEHFFNSLDFSGFLVLGKSEGVLQNGGDQFFWKYDKENNIFKKKVF